ncbi:MAG: alpha/beta fold hydrolase [Burkholderiales bacterium]|nr:alpha/beta fold hydrolase [Burkholderiales bacterium]
MVSSHFRQLLVLPCLLSVCICQPLFAETVEARLPTGTVATAEFRAGKPDLPAILLIHGFMQTRDFPTVSRLADGLANAGYTTLSPTLSLGISRRASSLPCEAVHRHTLEQDVAEISFWVNWLARRKPGSVVIVGHSYGSLQSLIYAVGKPAPTLRRVIALSLVDAERQSDPRTVAAMLSDAKKRIARGETQLVSYPLGYCKQYMSTPQSFLSYARWNRPDILRLSRQSKVPLEVIMGGSDDRMGEDWPEKLRSAGNSVQVIAGANHFFDAEHEFDMLDLTVSLLKSSEKKN